MFEFGLIMLVIAFMAMLAVLDGQDLK